MELGLMNGRVDIYGHVFAQSRPTIHAIIDRKPKSSESRVRRLQSILKSRLFTGLSLDVTALYCAGFN